MDLSFMQRKCKSCGYYVECDPKQFEEWGEQCEDCFEKSCK